MATSATIAPITESCVSCHTSVELRIDPRGGLATVDAHGYCGLTDSGEPVCRDCFCTVCGEYHTNTDAHDRCAFYGVLKVDLTPPCSIDLARAILDKMSNADDS